MSRPGGALRLGRQIRGTLQAQPSREDPLDDVVPKFSGDAVPVFHDAQLAKPVLQPFPVGLRAADPVPQAVGCHGNQRAER
jgi:hypothetical protein